MVHDKSVLTRLTSTTFRRLCKHRSRNVVKSRILTVLGGILYFEARKSSRGWRETVGIESGELPNVAHDVFASSFLCSDETDALRRTCKLCVELDFYAIKCYTRRWIRHSIWPRTQLVSVCGRIVGRTACMRTFLTRLV